MPEPWSRRLCILCLCRVAALVRQHDFADADAWVANWQAEWDATLARCRKGGGKCRVFVR